MTEPKYAYSVLATVQVQVPVNPNVNSFEEAERTAELLLKQRCSYVKLIDGLSSYHVLDGEELGEMVKPVASPEEESPIDEPYFETGDFDSDSA